MPSRPSFQPFLLCAISLAYVAAFTYAVAILSIRYLGLDIFTHIPALLLTLALAVSTLFASPLLPRCCRMMKWMKWRLRSQKHS